MQQDRTIPSNELRDLREHVALMEAYWRGLDRERERLWKPHVERVKKLRNRLLTPLSRGEEPIREGREVREKRVRARAKQRARLEHEFEVIHGRIQADLAEWRARHKPDVPTLDTPARIAADLRRYLDVVLPRPEWGEDPRKRYADSIERAHLVFYRKFKGLIRVAPFIYNHLPKSSGRYESLIEILATCEWLEGLLADSSTDSGPEGAATRSANAKRPSQSRLSVTLGKRPSVKLDDTIFPASSEAAIFLGALIDADGHRVSFASLRKDDGRLAGSVGTRLLASLPAEVLAYIERPGKGKPARLMVERLSAGGAQ